MITAYRALDHPAAGFEPRGSDATGPELGDRQVGVPRLGGKSGGPIAVAVAEPFLAAPMADGTKEGGDLKLDHLLQAVAGQLGNQRPALVRSSNGDRSTASQWVLGMVCLDEVVLKPGKRAWPPFSTSAGGPIARGARPNPAILGWGGVGGFAPLQGTPTGIRT